MHKFYNHNSLKPFPLEKESVNLVCTSPPYFGLRNYRENPDQIGAEEESFCGLHGTGECGQCYVCHMVRVARNIREVLTKDGSFYLNIGDSYFDKSLALVPHLTAIALCQDGWILRNTIIWSKPAPMPTSVKDRLNTTHEYIFHFVKSQKYYYNLDAIRVPHQTLKAERYFGDGVDKEAFLEELTKKGIQVSELPKNGDITMLIAGESAEFKPEDSRYKNTKLDGEDKINVGARGGFAQNGETMQNRYADGGKNPGDVFVEERKFTLEDELRAEKEYGYTRHAAARVTARLKMKGMVKNHPLGKNPGDVHINTDAGVTDERASDMWWLEGFETECPQCGSQFKTSANEFYLENPDDIWRVNTESNPLKHFAVWPRELVRRMIVSSSRPGDTVLDPFAGSGTTIAMAEKYDRVGIGFDLSYEDVQEQRMSLGITHDGMNLFGL